MLKPCEFDSDAELAVEAAGIVTMEFKKRDQGIPLDPRRRVVTGRLASIDVIVLADAIGAAPGDTEQQLHEKARAWVAAGGSIERYPSSVASRRRPRIIPDPRRLRSIDWDREEAPLNEHPGEIVQQKSATGLIARVRTAIKRVFSRETKNA